MSVYVCVCEVRSTVDCLLTGAREVVKWLIIIFN